MKKVLFAAAFAAFVLTSCGSDDDGGNNCVTCLTIEYCEGDNGNAFNDGNDTGVPFDSINGSTLCN